MGSGATTRYVDDVLELVGVKGKSRERVARAVSVPDIEVYSMAEQIEDRTRQHHRESWARIREDLLQEKQPKAFYFYSPKTAFVLSAGTGRLLRRAALYFNKIVMEDPLSFLTTTGYTPNGVRRSLATYIEVLRCLEPWVAEGFVELTPDYQQVGSIAGLVDRCEEMDSADSDWQKHVSDLLSPEEVEDTIQRMTTPEALTWMGKGNATHAVRQIFSRASSMKIGYSYFGGNLTECIPVTESPEMWNLFQFWVSRRMSSDTCHKTIVDAFMRDARAGRAWLALDARELLVLDRLDPSTIIEVRNSSEHSFQTFRSDLGKAVDEIQGLTMENEAAYREAADHAWEKVIESANVVRKEKPTIEKKLKVDGMATVCLASLSLGLAPVVPTAALTSAVAAIAPGRDLIKNMIDRHEMKKSSGYFLLKLEEAETST